MKHVCWKRPSNLRHERIVMDSVHVKYRLEYGQCSVNFGRARGLCHDVPLHSKNKGASSAMETKIYPIKWMKDLFFWQDWLNFVFENPDTAGKAIPGQQSTKSQTQLFRFQNRGIYTRKQQRENEHNKDNKPLKEQILYSSPETT